MSATPPAPAAIPPAPAAARGGPPATALAVAESVALAGIDACPVRVEVAIAPGLPSFTIVGLPDPAIQEARERVRAAIQSCGEAWPQRRVTVNLSPAHLRKTGSSFDLAVGVAILAACGRLPADRIRGICVIGELSLDGSVGRVRGVLPSVLAARAAGARAVMVPLANAAEASIPGTLEVVGVDHLTRAVAILRGEEEPPSLAPHAARPADPAPGDPDHLDFADVRGQPEAKRALEIAAAGGHSVLMWGPPGGGKTMLARRLPSILPPMSDEESFEVARIRSVAGLLDESRPLDRMRPFRAPHHTISMAGLIGGGSGVPQPGEVSLAHRGVLFLDEGGEFRRDCLQALRGPIEDGAVTIVRSRWAVTYPSRFQMVLATNPCPCGKRLDPLSGCECPAGAIARYRERLSGPILDRVDIRVRVDRVATGDLFGPGEGEQSAAVRARVVEARALQRHRLARRGAQCNAEIPARSLVTLARLTPEARRGLGDAVEGLALSARGAHRAIRVGRTVADLAGSDTLQWPHLEEALQFRMRDGSV